MDKLLSIVTSKRLYGSLFIIIFCVLLYTIISKAVNRVIEKNTDNDHIAKRKNTYLKLTLNIIKYVIMVVAILCVLQLNGINVTSVIAGLGVVSLIAGLAIQDALKDVIMGFNIIVDNYFSVGDYVSINGIEGKVIELGFKTTKIKDLANNVYVIANRNITSSLNFSKAISVDIPVPYNVDSKKVEEVFEILFKKVLENNIIISIKNLGITDFADSAIMYKISIEAKQENRYTAKRFVLGMIKNVFDEEKISIPYKQIDVHLDK